MHAAKLVLIVLGFIAAACFSVSAFSAPQADQQEENLTFPNEDPAASNENLTFPDEDQVAPGENLTFPEEDQAASSENLTFPDVALEGTADSSDSFRDSGSGNVTVNPIEFPATDFSQAANEMEPNEEPETASKFGAVSTGTDDQQYAAQGTLNGRDTDFFSFSVQDAAQLYLIEATGPGVRRMTLYESAGMLAKGKESKDGARLSISNIYLAPGDYQVSVEHFRDDGETAYTIRAISLGAPDRHREREPNDVVADAEQLKPGIYRTGLFLEPDDVDYYRFSLPAEQLVTLRVEPPPEVRLSFALNDGLRSMGNKSADDPGTPIEYKGLLQPGEYTLNLQPREGASTTPYVVSLVTGNRFQPLVDLEPNDQPHQARPIPANGSIHGRARDFGDYDWYRLPRINGPTVITIHSEFGSSGLWLQRLVGEKTEEVELEWLEEQSVFSGNLQGGERYLLQIGRSYRPKIGYRPDYAFQVQFDPMPAGESGMEAGSELTGVSLRVSENPPAFAAFWHESQSSGIPLTISNERNKPVRLRLDAATSHPAWKVSGPVDPVAIGPGQTTNVPITLQVAPDAPSDVPVRVDFRVVDERGAAKIASISAFGACGAEPVNPGPIWTLPDALLGGFNVAWSSLGSRVLDAPDDSYGVTQTNLYDGMTPNDNNWARTRPTYPVDLTVQLAGENLVPVAGVVLNPQGKSRGGPAWPGTQVRDFELYLSRNGTDFEKALAGTLSRARIPQHFVLAEPTEARVARLRVLSAHDPGENRVGLGEFTVVADPTANPVPGRRLNLADPAHGGYIAWSRPRFSHYAEAEELLTEDVEQPSLKVDPVLPTEWVLGFHHNRAAQISELQWVDSPEDPTWPRLNSVQVSISMDGAAGPWEALGTWTLDRAAGSPPPFVLEEPVWARFVRFVSTEAESAGRWEMPDTLRVLERSVDAEYRSILAEWGQYSRAAIYERMRESAAPASQVSEHALENGQKASALRMNAGTSYSDQVERGSRVAWYRIDVPADHNRLRFRLSGKPVADVSATLEDDSGTSLPLEEVPTPGSELVLESDLDGGKTYWLRLEEPVRHVVVAWDNSGSVRPYWPVIYSAIGDFIGDLQPGNEFVKLLPFSVGGFLLADWSDQTGPLMAGLQSYPRRDDDSNAETYLLTASNTLALEEGAKAVIIVTDAATFSYDETPVLWDSLASTRPRVFAVELHVGDKVAYQQDLMQSWADVNSGFYAPFRQQNDLDVAFDRAFCHLRRPVRFDVVADSRFEEPPGPGLLAVDAGNAISANAVELILDASGSMLQRLEGTRRIEVARTVLTDLVNETIPEGTPLALRVFGHRKPDACDTDLASPLQPLDRARVTGIIQGTQAMNLARTPIGESLSRVADDLKGVDGQKLIILITDGEETCDGDPAAAIAALKESGHDVRVNIVGFAIDDAALKAEFEEWSRIGGGLYFNASSAAELDEALQQALRPKYQVLDATGAIIATGTTGAEDIELPSGTYTVKILTSPIQTFSDVKIEAKETTRISATGED